MRKFDSKEQKKKEYGNGKVKHKITDTEDTLYLFSKKQTEAIKRYREFVYAGIKKKYLT